MSRFEYMFKATIVTAMGGNLASQFIPAALNHTQTLPTIGYAFASAVSVGMAAIGAYGMKQAIMNHEPKL